MKREWHTQAYKRAREEAILKKPLVDEKSTQTAATDSEEASNSDFMERRLQQLKKPVVSGS